MTRKEISILIGAVVAAAGVGAGVTAAVSSGSGTTQAGTGAASVSAVPPYSYYRSMMSRYLGGSPGSMMGGGGGYGSMMGGGGGYGWMMGAAGYRWMFGAAGAPGWMRGAHLPAAITGTSTDMGQIMGRLWADAPGPRVSPADAARLATQVPAGATVSTAARTLTFTGRDAALTAVASPAGGPDDTFRIAGLVNPTIIVPAGSTVSIRVINADRDTAHGLVVTASNDLSSPMPMMTARPAFAGSALWFLGNPTAAGLHAGTLTFTAATPGTYYYLCPVPGHARKGMTGQLKIR